MTQDGSISQSDSNCEPPAMPVRTTRSLQIKPTEDLLSKATKVISDVTESPIERPARRPGRKPAPAQAKPAASAKKPAQKPRGRPPKQENPELIKIKDVKSLSSLSFDVSKPTAKVPMTNTDKFFAHMSSAKVEIKDINAKPKPAEKAKKSARNHMDLIDCQCSFECPKKFNMVERIKMNMEFQKKNPAGRKAWISKHCWKDLNPRSQSHNQAICNLPKEGKGGRNEVVRVCKKFFLGTLGFQGKSGNEWKFGDIKGEPKSSAPNTLQRSTASNVAPKSSNEPQVPSAQLLEKLNSRLSISREIKKENKHDQKEGNKSPEVVDLDKTPTKASKEPNSARNVRSAKSSAKAKISAKADQENKENMGQLVRTDLQNRLTSLVQAHIESYHPGART